MLEIKNFSKNYKNKKAVSNLNLKIEDKDIFAFIGHNGAGKTTTIKSIVGILDFDSGDIILDGISIKKDPFLFKQKIAYVPDNPDIYEYLSGIEYLTLISDIYRLSNEDRESIKKYADLFELTSALNNSISSYSHGMKQKLVIISALIHNPKLLVLDEPFVGLDPKSTHILKETLKLLCEKGSIVFFSTHVLEVAEKLCNKVAIIKNGQLIKSGLTKDIIKDKSLEDVFMELENE